MFSLFMKINYHNVELTYHFNICQIQMMVESVLIQQQRFDIKSTITQQADI